MEMVESVAVADHNSWNFFFGKIKYLLVSPHFLVRQQGMAIVPELANDSIFHI